MSESYQHLGAYSDLVAEAFRQRPLYPLAPPGPETQARVREVLGFCSLPEEPLEVRVEDRWEKGGLIGEEISWSVGYGPRTRAWLFRPLGATQPLPGVLALHDHGGFKAYGKEKIAEGKAQPEDYIQGYWTLCYGGRAWVNALARAGYVVLVHDTFLWGSRKFTFEQMQDTLNVYIPEEIGAWPPGAPQDVSIYNYVANHHEHLVEKYCIQLGTCMAGVICHEDRIALNYLRSRPEVQIERLGCMGLSGGGNRAGMLRATAEGLRAAAVVGLMSTYQGLLDHNIQSHTWMLFPSGWARYGDWSDLVACQAPAPLLVQYDIEDDLFTLEGMQAADRRLAQHYRSVGHPEGYTGQFYPGPHKFDLEMQAAAFQWLDGKLK